ncbi:hypothetical protein PCE31107_03881 [Pandoraea cepalis]|uniref:Uncharacterized protein n=1 Tax=Pandoraea cepalis TaxID=2508294 RepID=A0A5E4XGM3_9BURK|nr:hypothetical protein PCE31107_03881 [Pandoraea cepalis]
MPNDAYTDNQNNKRRTQAALQHVGDRRLVAEDVHLAPIRRVAVYIHGYSAPPRMRLRDMQRRTYRQVQPHARRPGGLGHQGKTR